MSLTGLQVTDPRIFEHNLSIFEQAKGSKGRFEFGQDERGRIVVKVSPEWSLVLWIKNTFLNRSYKRIFHAQVLEQLSSPSASKSLRERLVKDIREGVFPFVSTKESVTKERVKLAARNVAGDTPGFKDISVHNERRKASEPEKTSEFKEVAEPMKAPEHKEVSGSHKPVDVQGHEPVSEDNKLDFENEILNARAVLQAEWERIEKKSPYIGIADVQGYVHSYLTLVAMGVELDAETQDNEYSLGRFFFDTRQTGLFLALWKDEAGCIFQRLIHKYPNDYKKHLLNLEQSDSPQSIQLHDYINHIHSKLSVHLSYSGDRPDLVTADEMDFLEEWRRTSPSPGMNRLAKSLSDFDVTWQQAGGFVAEQNFTQLNTNVAKTLLEERERLWSEITRRAPRSPARKALQKKLEQFEEGHRSTFETLARGRAQYYKIQASVGRRWAPDFLRSEACTGKRFSQYYQKPPADAAGNVKVRKLILLTDSATSYWKREVHLHCGSRKSPGILKGHPTVTSICAGAPE